jgi:hypothetical protein
MTTALLDCLNRADTAFSAATPLADRYPVPPVDPDRERRLEAYREARLGGHVEDMMREDRTTRAEAAGFCALPIAAIVADLMGSPPTAAHSEQQSQRYERIRGNRSTDDWHMFTDVYPILFVRARTPLGRFGPCVWRARMGVVNRLAVAIPYGVVLRMNEVWEARLFDCFHAIAPLDAWRPAPVRVDPVIVGTIFPQFQDYRWRPDRDGVHFPIARWS